MKNCILLDADSTSIIARGNPAELRDTSTDPRVSRFLKRSPTNPTEYLPAPGVPKESVS